MTHTDGHEAPVARAVNQELLLVAVANKEEPGLGGDTNTNASTLRTGSLQRKCHLATYKPLDSLEIEGLEEKFMSAFAALSAAGADAPLSAITQNTLLVADGSCPKIRRLLAVALAPVLWLQTDGDPLAAVTDALAERRRMGQPVPVYR